MTRLNIVSESPLLIIYLPPPMKVHFILFLLVWISFWLFAGPPMSGDALFTDPQNVLSLILWSILGLICISLLLWQLAGKEIVICDHEFITIKNVLFGIPLTRKCRLSKVSDFKVNWDGPSMFDLSTRFEYIGLGGGKIVFDYGGYSKKFGIGIDESEAGQVINLIKKYVENHAGGYRT